MGFSPPNADLNARAAAVAALAQADALKTRITGTPTVGSALTVVPSTGTAPTSYQWRRNGSPISGATGASYTLVQADQNATIDVVAAAAVTAPAVTVGTGGVVTPPPTPAAPTVTTVPSISGSTAVGSTLTVTPGVYGGYPTPVLTRQWTRNGQAISGATSTTYVLVDADAGLAIRCVETVANASGTITGTSNAITAAAGAAPQAPLTSSSPVIVGNGTLGSTLTVTPGTYTGSPAPTITRQWTRDNVAIAGAVGTTYTVVQADATKTIRCSETATNASGNVMAISNGIAIAAAAAPTIATNPTIAGGTSTGSTLTVTPGTYNGAPTPIVTRRWTRDGADIPGETGTTYVIVLADGGKAIRCVETATNQYGTVDAPSNAAGVPAGVPPTVTTAPSISGTPAVGQQLTVTPGTYGGSPAPTTTKQWTREGAAIPNATQNSYLVSIADAGKTLRCLEIATNASGSITGTSNALAVPADSGPAEPVSVRMMQVPGNGLNTYNSYPTSMVTQPDGTQYAVFVDEALNPVLEKKIPGQDPQYVALSGESTNALVTPTVLDGHNSYHVGIGGDGIVHVMGNLHVNPLRYVRMSVPNDITSFIAGTLTGVDENSMTYPSFLHHPDGTLLLHHRNGSSGNGDNFLTRWNPTTKTWARIQPKFVDGLATSENFYPFRLQFDAFGVMHMMGNWRGTMTADSNTDLCHAKSEDKGVTWKSMSGTTLVLPLRRSGGVTNQQIPVAQPIAPGSGLLNANAQDVDSLGRPHLAYLIYDTNGKTQMRHLYYSKAGAWVDEAITTNLTWRMETVGVGIIDQSIGRCAVFCTPAGRTLVLNRVDLSDRPDGGLRAWDVTPADTKTDLGLATLPNREFKITDGPIYGAWEPSGVDVASARDRGELAFYANPLAPPYATAPYYHTDNALPDDIEWRYGWMLSFRYGLTEAALLALSNGTANIPKLSALTATTPAAVTGTETVFTEKATLAVPSSVAGKMGLARLKVSGAMSAGTGSAALVLIDGNGHETIVAQSDFTTATKTKTSVWVPLRGIAAGQTGTLKLRTKVASAGQTLTLTAASIETGTILGGDGQPVPRVIKQPVDTFRNRNAVPLQNHRPGTGGGWLKHPTASPDLVIDSSSDAIRATSTSTAGYCTHEWASTPGVAVKSRIQVKTLAGYIDLVARAEGLANTGLRFRLHAGNKTAQLIRLAAGTGIAIGATVSGLTIAVGDEIEVEFRSKDGIQEGYINGVLICSGTDTTITAPGRVGLASAGTSANAAGMQILDYRTEILA